jgi:HEAT repeat protein
MTTSECKATVLASAAAAAPLGTAHAAAGPGPVEDLIARIQSKDDSVRGPAWQTAARWGAPAVKPLVAVMQDQDFEVARSARRALWVITRHAGRPGASKEAKAVAHELVSLLAGSPSSSQRELLWMLSEIGSDDDIAAMAALLSDSSVREDARCALMRMPGRKSTAALKSAFVRAPEDFKFALAESLRQRGESVKGFPSQKLVPSRSTAVTQPKLA